MVAAVAHDMDHPGGFGQRGQRTLCLCPATGLLPLLAPILSAIGPAIAATTAGAAAQSPVPCGAPSLLPCCVLLPAGVNNAFLVNCKDPLAVTYNDSSGGWAGLSCCCWVGGQCVGLDEVGCPSRRPHKEVGPCSNLVAVGSHPARHRVGRLLIASSPSAPCAAVLENRHVACLYSLLPSRPDIDIFSRLEAAQWREVGAVPCCAGRCCAVLCVLSYFAAVWMPGWLDALACCESSGTWPLLPHLP